ncbi:GNAT family N-acetyltransferase [Sphingomonas sp. So64.6b]|uniref:GNAT family N-acetyltransferase n=1 Tax=Sphingomonas sp. So64.6b TaxID=2997354 RepID=UPI0015FEBEAD|nr:GNAT family N-acetyltransferase [Sphingomonas sp. So64.6b]QNA85231.1 GNAT family N-acetyltransferase [Sphingomonas sp. So64.6b]
MADPDRAKEEDETLREMARHRGFKLVKSRRRKPGVGDYGRYGLSDSAGKQVLGFGAKGLTATGEEIAAFLRKGELSAWGASVDATPARPIARKPASKPEAETIPQPEPAIRPRRAGRRTAPATPEPREKPEPAPAAPPPPSPEPTLAIRKATKNDADAIAALIGGADDSEVIGARITEALRAKAVILVADRDGVIGVVVGSAFTTLQSGRIGRLSLILVSRNEQRQGVGRLLVDAAQAALTKQGCALVEAVSDIAIRNAHAFFRKLGFEQASYRFTRAGDAFRG